MTTRPSIKINKNNNEPSFSPFSNGTQFYLADGHNPLVLTQDGWFSFQNGEPEKYTHSMLLSISTDLSQCDFDTWIKAVEKTNYIRSSAA